MFVQMVRPSLHPDWDRLYAAASAQERYFFPAGEHEDLAIRADPPQARLQAARIPELRRPCPSPPDAASSIV